MDSIMDVLTMQQQQSSTLDKDEIGTTDVIVSENPSNYLNISDEQQYKQDAFDPYDESQQQQDELMMMANANEEYQPVPAPPNGDEAVADSANDQQQLAQNGKEVEQESSATKKGTENGTHSRHRSSSRRRHGSKSRSKSRNRSRSRRSRSRSRSRHRRRRTRSRSPRRRSSRTRRHHSPSRSSTAHKDRDLNLRYRWERTIFVSNIPYEVKWAELKDLFRQKCGENSVIYCEIYERVADGKSLGVASVELRSVADAQRAVEVMHGYEMDGRKLSVRMDSEGFKARQSKEMAEAGSSSGRRDSPERRSNGFDTSGGILGMLGLGATNQNANNTAWLNSIAAQLKIEGPVTKRIFVASLDYKVEEQKLREVFGLAGRVRSVSLFRDRDNKSRGMALIEYETAFDALNAVAMFNKQTLFDREMNVRFDTKPPTKDEEERSARSSSSSSSSKLPSGLRSIGNGLSGLTSLLTPAAVNPLGGLGGLGGIGTALTGLGAAAAPPVSNALTLGALTALAGLNSGALSAAAGSAGLSGALGSALSQSTNQPGSGLGSGLNASGLNSQNSGNIGLGPSSNGDGFGNGFGSLSGPAGGLFGGFGNQFMESKNSGMNGSKSETSRGITKIFIKNLPFSWDERRLKEKFSQAGRIEYAEIKKKDGKSRGFGMIRYTYPDQAEKAVELYNGSNFDGRTLEVKLDLM